MVRVYIAAPILAMALAASVKATSVTFTNKCSYEVELYDNSHVEKIAAGSNTVRELSEGFNGMFRHGTDPQATLAELSIVSGVTWYDISAIPPGPGNCKSFEDCKSVTGKKGFNVALSMAPAEIDGITVNKDVCNTITCNSEQCADAYLYPTDDGKVHNCPSTVPINVIFCPDGKSTTTAPSTTPLVTPTPTSLNAFASDAEYESGVVNAGKSKPTTAPAPAPAPVQQSGAAATNGTAVSFPGATLKSSFTYSGKKAGNVAGTYGMVTNSQTCTKETVSVNSPVGPLSEEVSMVFRGPMNIYNIAVFDGSAGGDWKKVSSYDDSGAATNMIFMNNKNVDYATGVKSPQGFATADGLSVASKATTFSGTLAEASNPSQIGAGAGVSTGAEVNVMTSKKCSDSSCKGYYDDNGYHGWDGGKKMFVTKVKMPTGSSPNQPAIWMLNAQVLRSNQYQCNCRGSGAVGGCGELDIAEVIETNDARDKVSTHYYFYDGSIAAGGDNYAARPTNIATTYVTIINSDGEGTIKILEIGENDFDFSASAVTEAQIKAWISASDKNLIN
ncbi:hypothetical protein Poli38472_000172 [Pythium oligandrum]|uniref:glucan endo-1,3-beta-D-glucosidase n=1 Tax=Pythium oligandrum TaxID=41045 RepID=A0A8K1CBL8_PYTOL|nr:hypothetical protein Poli38472_000172 [Pythium oligandrum]|eukprot:TMW60130.1 hypothetical protein Poli38472_000172 [Pythium oligandrum]